MINTLSVGGSNVVMLSPGEQLCRCLCGEIPPDIDWMEIIAVANEHMIAPLLFRKLVATGSAELVDSDAIAYLAQLDEANTVRNARITKMLIEVVTVLNAVAIHPMVIKGGRDLLLRDDPGAVARLMLDVDIVVSEHELQTARDALEDCGFLQIEETEYAHSPGTYWRAGDVATVDLHIQLPSAIDELLTAQDVAEHTVTLDCGGAKMRIPDASLHLCIGVAHDMLHHDGVNRGSTELRYLVELADQLDTQSRETDWAWVEAKKSNSAFGRALDLQILMVCHLFGTSPPLSNVGGLGVRILHYRRLLKMRFPKIGYFEWRIVRYVLKKVRELRTDLPPGRSA